jgi:hypothetical protein
MAEKILTKRVLDISISTSCTDERLLKVLNTGIYIYFISFVGLSLSTHKFFFNSVGGFLESQEGYREQY